METPISSSTSIHPTAIVHPGATVSAGCVVGPYCVIGDQVALGEGCVLENHVSLAGPSRFGARNHFYPFCSLGQRTQDLKYVSEPTFLEVGEGNTFREFVTVNRGTSPGAYTRIGSRGNFLAYAHVAHDCTVGDGVIFSNNGTIAGHVEVGDYAIIGGLTAVHQFCRIGTHAITGGCSKIVQDVPPFMIADGNPAVVRGFNKVGLERHGFDEAAVKAIKDGFRLIYRCKYNLQQAMEQIRAQVAEVPVRETLLEFVGNSPRGIIK